MASYFHQLLYFFSPFFLEKSGEEGMLFSDSEIDLGTSTVIKSYF